MPNEEHGAHVWSLNFRLSTGVLDKAAAEMAAIGIEVKEFFVLDGVEERPASENKASTIVALPSGALIRSANAARA